MVETSAPAASATQEEDLFANVQAPAAQAQPPGAGPQSPLPPTPPVAASAAPEEDLFANVQAPARPSPAGSHAAASVSRYSGPKRRPQQQLGKGRRAGRTWRTSDPDTLGIPWQSRPQRRHGNGARASTRRRTSS